MRALAQNPIAALLHRGRRTVLAAIVGCAALAQPLAAANSREPRDLASALEGYARRAATLRQAALAAGSVSYLDVLEAAYGAGTISPEVLAAKDAWRRAHAATFDCVTDYSALLDEATVTALHAHPDPNLQSTLVAQYESLSHTIGIAPIAADFAIFHEAGHALQRAALRARGSAQSRRSELPDFLVMHEARHREIDPTTLHRLEYLCSQVELEVRLQDLNRFHAFLTGAPIMDAADAVRALAALGMPLTYEETRDAFALARSELTPEAFARATEVDRPQAGRIAVAFEDARELRLVRTLSRRIDPACWTGLLAKLLFEAPGHL